MSLYESFLLLNMFRMLLHSSSGAGDCMYVYCTTCSNLHSDTTLLQPNRTNIPVHTRTEQYTYIQSPAPEDECNNIRNMLKKKKLS
jgi:hypothetical protein